MQGKACNGPRQASGMGLAGGYTDKQIQQPGTRLTLLLFSGYVKGLSSRLNGEIVSTWGIIPRSASIEHASSLFSDF